MEGNLILPLRAARAGLRTSVLDHEPSFGVERLEPEDVAVRAQIRVVRVPPG